MIRVKSVGYQQDNVVLEIEFDHDGDVHMMSISTKAANLLDMTVDEIKDAIVKKVQQKRLELSRAAVEEKLSEVIEVDLEAS